VAEAAPERIVRSGGTNLYVDTPIRTPTLVGAAIQHHALCCRIATLISHEAACARDLHQQCEIRWLPPAPSRCLYNRTKITAGARAPKQLKMRMHLFCRRRHTAGRVLEI